MIEETSQLDIKSLIEGGEFFKLKSELGEMEIHDLAEVLAELDEENELPIAFRLLPTERAAEILGELELDKQEDLLTRLSGKKVADIINEMPPDDRTELFEELPGEMVQKLMNQLRGEQLKIARTLLGYPEDSIGRLMTPNYIAVREDWTIEKVLQQIRKLAKTRETFNVIYVVDAHWKLLDEIQLEDIVLAEPDQTVADIMDNQVSSLDAADDQEVAVEEFKKYDALVLPVVDKRGTLVGIVTVDDIMDIQEEETTEDMQKMAALVVMDESYFATGFMRMATKRLPWLLLLLLVETFAVMLLDGFAELLVLIVMFMPLINAAAGNTGAQISTLMIRGFAVNEISLGDWLRVLTREASRGVVMGVVLAVLAGSIAMVFSHEPGIALAVGIAMIAAVTLANILGSMLPFIFKRIGIDPAVTSGPFISCLMDISSILIFFSIASSMRHFFA
ncbi:MAG: magnesium transporter [Phycisphaerae bacterium]|nr:magnesium transporter [Phycisphaerae bacterium]